MERCPAARSRRASPSVRALVREMREETGLEVEPGRLLYVCDHLPGTALTWFTSPSRPRAPAGQSGTSPLGLIRGRSGGWSSLSSPTCRALGFSERFGELAMAGFPRSGQLHGCQGQHRPVRRPAPGSAARSISASEPDRSAQASNPRGQPRVPAQLPGPAALVCRRGPGGCRRRGSTRQVAGAAAGGSPHGWQGCSRLRRAASAHGGRRAVRPGPGRRNTRPARCRPDRWISSAGRPGFDDGGDIANTVAGVRRCHTLMQGFSSISSARVGSRAPDQAANAAAPIQVTQ